MATEQKPNPTTSPAQPEQKQAAKKEFACARCGGTRTEKLRGVSVCAECKAPTEWKA